MSILELLREKNMSIYKLARSSGLPYATLNDICNEKTRLEKCSAETVYRLSLALDVSMEELIAPRLENRNRSSFENFKSDICHRVKELGDIDFIIETLKSGDIQTYYKRKWFPECLYLLAMLDYISRENNVPLNNEYDDLRKCKLERTVYPSSLLAVSTVAGDDEVLKEAYKKSIPEFIRFNIVENEVRDVV